MKPTNYVNWEARHGIRVVVHDTQRDGTRITRVGIWEVPETVREAAKAFKAAQNAWKADPQNRAKRAAMESQTENYRVAMKDLRPPPSGATPIGYLAEAPNGTWSWYPDANPALGGNAPTIGTALGLLVDAVMQQDQGPGCEEA